MNAQEAPAVVDSVAASKANAQAPPDSIKFKQQKFNSLLIGVDLIQPASHLWNSDQLIFNFSLESPFKNSNLVLDAGVAKAQFSTTNLSYNSNSFYLSPGVNKFFFDKVYDGDKDDIFVGIRYGLGFINRGQATYTVSDIWGSSSGVVAAKSNIAHWGQICLGLRMQIAPKLFLGWAARGNFIINGKTFVELPPSYIAGYGRGDKPSAFTYNLMFSYLLN